MRSTLSDSTSDARSPRARALGAALAALVAGGCDTTDFGPVAFRCGGTDRAAARCPGNYRCVSNVCVRNDVRVPALLSPSLAEGENAFGLHPSGSDLLVCWNQSITTGTPGVHSVVLAPDGTYRVPPRVTYSDTNSAIAILGVHGACVRRGNSVFIGVNRQSGRDAFLFSFYRVEDITQPNAAAMRVQDLPPFAERTVIPFQGTPFGAQSWMPYVEFEARGADARRRLVYAIVDEGLMASRVRTMLPLYDTIEPVVATEMLAGDGGVWYSARTQSGRTDLAWVEPATPPTSTVTQPVPSPLAAYPLAVRGRELAIAYHVSARTWQVAYLSPDGASRMGPSLDLDASLVRPGGYVDGERLYVAGTDESRALRIWSTAWGTSEAPRREAEFSRISLADVERVALTAVSGHWHVVWSEHVVPDTSTGAVEYTALYTDATPR